MPENRLDQISNPAFRMEKTVAWIVFVAVFLGTLAVRVYFADLSPYVDEGDHLNGPRIVARGGLMYRDTFNEKGPGLYWITAGIFRVFGEGLPVIRATATVCALFTLILLFALGNRLAGPGAGALAALLFAVAHPLFEGLYFQSETYLTPLLLCVMFFLMPTPNQGFERTKGFFAGVALFLMTLIKQPAWLIVFAVAGAITVDWYRSNHKRPSKEVSGLIVGLVLPWVAVLFLVAGQGIGETFLRGYFFPILLHASGHYLIWPTAALTFLLIVLGWLGIMSLATAFRGPAPFRTRLLFALILIFTCVMLLPAFFPFHFAPVMAMTGLGFALSVFSGSSSLTLKRWFAPGVLCGLMVLALLATPFDALFYHYQKDNRAVFEQISDDIKKDTTPADTIFVFPIETIYYYMADRRAPGRFAFLLPWVTPTQVLEEFLAEFAAKPPKLILYAQHSVCPSVVPPRDYLAPLLHEIVGHYRVDRGYQNAVIRFVRDGTPTTRDRCVSTEILYSDDFCPDRTGLQIIQEAGRLCP